MELGMMWPSSIKRSYETRLDRDDREPDQERKRRIPDLSQPEKAYLEVKLITRGGKTVAEVIYKSPGQFEEDEKRIKEAMEKRK